MRTLNSPSNSSTHTTLSSTLSPLAPCALRFPLPVRHSLGVGGCALHLVPLSVPFQQIFGQCFQGDGFAFKGLQSGERLVGELLGNLPGFFETHD